MHAYSRWQPAAPEFASRIIAVVLLCTSILLSQSKSVARPPDSSQGVPKSAVPLFDVKLTPDPDLSTPYDDRIPSNSEGCDSNGAPYIRMFKLMPHEISILRFGPKEIVTFSASKITDVADPTTVDDFPSGSRLYMLVEGDAHKEEVVKQLEDGSQKVYWETKGEPRSYIARFDEDGSYKGSHKLDLPFHPTRLSGFESGGFVTAGFDEDKIWRVALLDSSGGLLKYLEFPKEKEKSPEKSFERSFGTSAGDSNARSFMFAALASFFPYHGSVLYVRGHSGAPIYEITESGEVRAVKIKAPSGHAVDGFIPSDRNWLVTFGQMGELPNREQSVLYEVDMATGELLREYRVEQYSRFSEAEQEVACVYQDEFRAVRHEKGKLVMLRGTPQAPNGTVPDSRSEH
jgi:hypothetical protein